MDPADGATFAVKMSGPVDIIPGIVSEGNGEYSCTFTPVKVELFAKEAAFVTCIICNVCLTLPSLNLCVLYASQGRIIQAVLLCLLRCLFRVRYVFLHVFVRVSSLSCRGRDC